MTECSHYVHIQWVTAKAGPGLDISGPGLDHFPGPDHIPGLDNPTLESDLALESDLGPETRTRSRLGPAFAVTPFQ